MKLQGLVKVCAVVLFCLGNQRLLAQQLKLGTNPTLLDKNALLELNSTKQGFLLPRIVKAQILSGGALYGASEGMLVYITDDKALYLKKTTGWEKIDFSILTAGTGTSITGTTIDNTGVLRFNNRTGAVVPADGDYNLSQMGDVTITTPADKQILQYQGATSKWININAPFVDPSRKLILQAGTGISSVAASPVGTDLSADRTWTIIADNTAALWNAKQLLGYGISFATTPVNNDVLTFNGTNWISKAPATNGTVTSVGLSMPSIFTVSNSPVTTSGTLTATLANQNPNFFLAGPASGSAAAPAFRALVAADLPAGSSAYIQNNPATAQAASFNITGNGVTSGIFQSAKVAIGITVAPSRVLHVNGDMRLTGSAGTPTAILGRDGNGDINNVATDATTLAITAGSLAAKNTTAIWNANQLQGRAIATTAPTDGQILKWNTASSTFIPGDDITGGASYGTLGADNDIKNADAPDPKYRMKIWAGPGSGTVVNGPAGTNAWAWSVLSFQNSTYTTQLYFDKNTLALKEWGGNTAPLTDNTSSGNPWYKVVTTNGANSFTDGGITFAKKTSDATSEIAQDPTNFFWDNSSKELGIKTAAPNSTLHVNGSVATSVTVLANEGNTNVSYTLDGTMSTVLAQRVNTGTGKNITLTLPATNGNVGRIYVIRRSMVAGTVFIAPNGSDKLEGSNSSFSLTGLLGLKSVTIQCMTNTDWFIIAAY